MIQQHSWSLRRVMCMFKCGATRKHTNKSIYWSLNDLFCLLHWLSAANWIYLSLDCFVRYISLTSVFSQSQGIAQLSWPEFKDLWDKIRRWTVRLSAQQHSRISNTRLPAAIDICELFTKTACVKIYTEKSTFSMHLIWSFLSLQDIFLVFDKNKTHHLEYQEVAPALKAAGRT